MPRRTMVAAGGPARRGDGSALYESEIEEAAAQRQAIDAVDAVHRASAEAADAEHEAEQARRRAAALEKGERPAGGAKPQVGTAAMVLGPVMAVGTPLVPAKGDQRQPIYSMRLRLVA